MDGWMDGRTDGWIWTDGYVLGNATASGLLLVLCESGAGDTVSEQV